MADYRLTETGGVIRTIDGASIPNDPDNRDRQAYDAHVEAGGAVDPYVAPAIDLVAYAAGERWKKEVGGITVAGIPIATDDRAKLMIIGARVAADADSEWTTSWQGSDGNVYPIDATAMVAISNAVSAHVTGCFAIFATVKSGIDAGTVTTPEQVDAAFATE